MKDSVYTVILEAFSSHSNPNNLLLSKASLNDIVKQLWRDATVADVELILSRVDKYYSSTYKPSFVDLVKEWHNSGELTFNKEINHSSGKILITVTKQ